MPNEQTAPTHEKTRQARARRDIIRIIVIAVLVIVGLSVTSQGIYLLLRHALPFLLR